MLFIQFTYWIQSSIVFYTFYNSQEYGLSILYFTYLKRGRLNRYMPYTYMCYCNIQLVLKLCCHSLLYLANKYLLRQRSFTSDVLKTHIKKITNTLSLYKLLCSRESRQLEFICYFWHFYVSKRVSYSLERYASRRDFLPPSNFRVIATRLCVTYI